ncbi:hypothetical protein J2W30_003660 [Variovorax boronicumulans]|uniref:hypothetical protein n=1 Tax=Variovorax boronicumulans TaxID=436515 RepID=UPI00278A205F|nr:hypothetical protein [Variovorax boronicumulans]MDQ0035887.1 hypothetical protein [Variovorax boronicumulans]
MGLDITAYRRLTLRDSSINEDGEAVDPITGETLDDCLRVFANPGFPGREEGLIDRAVYAYEESDDVLGMSYGRYNAWRESLAKLAGYPLTEVTERFGPSRMLHAGACWAGATGPFSELINFADNEGTIGPVVAAKLARDFAEFEERAKAIGDDFYQAFLDLKRGSEMAADSGALDFH